MPGKKHCAVSTLWCFAESKNATKNITARLCADLDKQELWFGAFTDTIEAFLSRKNLTKAAE